MTSRAAFVLHAGWLTIPVLAGMQALAGPTPLPDPRLRDVTYSPTAVITVPVKRGVVTLVQLGEDEAITEVASGLGADCSKPEAAWCIAAQAGGRSLFVKPKSQALADNNLAVLTDKRAHQLRFVVLDENDPHPPVYRLQILAPTPAGWSAPPASSTPEATVRLPALPSFGPMPAPPDLLADRLQARAQIRNSAYFVALGKDSEAIEPSLVFDDGRFTYFRFPGNREVPAVFQVLGDGSESVVNSHMEQDLLVVDRVSPRFMLRAGAAVIGVWNEAFDMDGVPPVDGSTVPGVQRLIKPASDRLKSVITTGSATTPSPHVTRAIKEQPHD